MLDIYKLSIWLTDGKLESQSTTQKPFLFSIKQTFVGLGEKKYYY